MTDDDDFIPPIFTFSLPQFRNPRTVSTSGVFDLTIYDSSGDELYTWNQTDPDYSLTVNGYNVGEQISAGPVVQMSTAATPKLVQITRGSEQNGNVTWYEFTVQTTNYLVEGDQVVIEMPYPIFFSENSECFGRSTNLRNVQDCEVSVDLSKIVINLLLPVAYRRLQGSTETIRPDESYAIRITEVKNSPSYEPSIDSIHYSVYTQGALIEQKTSDLHITNSQSGEFSLDSVAVIPDDFRQSFATNYTLEFTPTNYQQNMKLMIGLPSEVLFGSNRIKCYGLIGTDKQDLDCQTSTTQKTISITDAFQYQRGNPGNVKIVFETLKNPTENIVTGSFRIATFTPNNYMLDSITTGVEVNFFCEYPCATCDNLIKDRCLSCYGGASDFIFYHEFQCWDDCPAGLTNTTTNNCTECIEPCATCRGSPNTCTSCIDGYAIVESKGYCREEVYWPFPYVLIGFLSFIIILISEIITKRESRFKEAFIAFLSIPEVFSWITFIVFSYNRVGARGPTALAALALLTYTIVNFAHAIVHPRKIVPNSLFSYK